MKSFYWVLGAACLAVGASGAENSIANDRCRIELGKQGEVLVRCGSAPVQAFAPRFTVLATERDPKLELRWGEWSDPKDKQQYNVCSWYTGAGPEKKKAAGKTHIEDGFIPANDQKAGEERTEDVFKAAPAVTLTASQARLAGNRVEWTFPEQAEFALSASVELPAQATEPRVTFRFTPKKAKWFSVAYTGAPEVAPAAMDEMWQPLIWQEKRFPSQAFLTEAARCTLPATLAAKGGAVWGVAAEPLELPFMPMPTPANSTFGVAVRNAAGQAQPAVFAPVLGGVGSRMKPGQTLEFKLRLIARAGRITDTYEALARGLYAFHDYRRNNGLGSLNRTLERTIDYAMSDWARFNDDLRGCAYDTDVPGSVKNVSPLHPLGLAFVTDDEALFTKRARPMIEYGMSREKFLFTVNPDVKGQGASANLKGPNLPVSELTALYEMTGKRSPFMLREAERLYGTTRTLNLDAAVRGDIWQNALALLPRYRRRQVDRESEDRRRCLPPAPHHAGAARLRRPRFPRHVLLDQLRAELDGALRNVRRDRRTALPGSLAGGRAALCRAHLDVPDHSE